MQPVVKKGTPFYVNMSNELVRSAHGLTLGEKRLLMLAIAKIDSEKPATPQNMVTRIDVSEFVHEFKITPQTAYTEVRHAAEQLMNRYIRFFYPDKDGKEIETRMQWVGRASYKKSEGWVELAFWHELSPMLFELQERFTSYKLDRVGGLRSVYSWRLFELLMQFKSTGKLRISVDEFTKIMEAPKSIKTNFANLRIKIIEPAVKEIREKDGLQVKWEPIKAGRKVQTLLFTFPQEQQVALPLKQPKPFNITKAYVEQHAYPGESYAQATHRLSRKK